MYFSRVTVAPQMLSRKELIELFAGNNYAEHQILWRLFDDDKRHYLFRRESGDNTPYARVGNNHALPVYYLVSQQAPQACRGLQVQSKPYRPVLTQGSELAFSLRANPIVSKKEPGKKNSVKCDVVMDAKTQAKAQSLDKLQRNVLIDEGVKSWLLKRTEDHGFAIDEQRLLWDGYYQHRFYKQHGGKPISVSSLDYNGILTVTDVDKFQRALFEGIGRAKAFGCGMMMIRRV